MQSQKCNQCGLVNFAAEKNCKKCGMPLAQYIESQQTQQSKGKSIIYNGGLSSNINGAVVIITAIIVCTLSIYFAKEYIPDGTYMIGCFLPFGFLGFIAGILLANILNVIYKQFR
jgi:ribosomal protein L37E